MSKQIPFGRRHVGDGLPVFIVFEAGATHDGLDSALKLVDIAADSGADAVKFQMLDAEKLIPDYEVQFSYEVLANKTTGRRESVVESLQAILKRRELSKKEWREVVARCRSRNIDFFSTATAKDDLVFLAELKADSVKIASGDIDYYHFMRQAAAYPWTVQIDTGNATLGEVERAVDVLEGAGCRNIIINHCPSGYPARMDGINLRVLTTLRQMFPYPVAFSDHTPGADMDIAAITLGAAMIEKTITLDRTIRSPEHIMSLEPDEAKAFVTTIRDVEQALGNPRRIFTEQEKNAPPVARRSVVAARDLASGTVLVQDDLDYARPGGGIPAGMDYLVLGKKLRRAMKRGERYEMGDVG